MRKKLIAALLICVCLAGAAWFFRPKLRANVFVALHSSSVEEAYQYGADSYEIGHDAQYRNYNDHSIVEFKLFAFGLVPSTSYYGCYYSPDDVPAPFQYVNLPLSQKNDGTWEWADEGDNHGTTVKIKDCWYYFEAHF